MASLRKLVTPPAFTPLGYGLLSVAEPAPPNELADPHWRLGVQIQADYCGPARTVLSTCATGIGTTKTVLPNGLPIRGADPFTVYAWLNCGPVGVPTDELRQQAERALIQGEAYAVENVFATGNATAGGVVLPHLAEDTAVTEGGGLEQTVLMQPAASVIVTGTVDVVEGIGRLEAALAGCYGGQGVLHVPQEVVAHLSANSLIKQQGQQLVTWSGHKVAAGAGYPGTSPAGATPAAGTLWLYATGAVKYWRSTIEFTSTWQQAVDRSINDLVLIAERTYVIVWDCCLFAIPVSLGGVITGSYNSAT